MTRVANTPNPSGAPKISHSTDSAADTTTQLASGNRRRNASAPAATRYDTYTAARGPVMCVEPKSFGAHTSSVHPNATTAAIATSRACWRFVTRPVSREHDCGASSPRWNTPHLADESEAPARAAVTVRAITLDE